MANINNRKIVKNSFFLYIRTIVLMLITLYTSRVVLLALGESDYGVYSIVGGVVILFSFINSALTGTTQRFMNVAMGHDSKKELKQIFNASRQIHVGIAILSVILYETVGLWFLINCLNIPPESKYAAHWVFQFSVLTTVFNILSAPYNAAIIAHECMSVFAYFSTIEGVLKLAVAFAITLVDSSRLIWYGGLLCLVSFLVRTMYNFFCTRKFEECRNTEYKVRWPLIKKMTSFSGWSLVGSVGFLACTQGFAFIVNIFFGTILNAALSIANQVNSASYQTVFGFLQAVRPQIMKSYSAGEINDMNTLVIRGSKIAVLLTAMFVIPVCLEADYLLKLWLHDVPEYTASFVRVILLTSLINAFLLVITAAQEATGKIRSYQLMTIIISLISLPVTWLLYSKGFSPVWGLYINCALAFVSQIVRLVMVHHSTRLNLHKFMNEILFRCGLCIIISFVIPCILTICFNQSALLSWSVMLSSIGVLVICALIFGLNKGEKYKVYQMISNRLRH